MNRWRRWSELEGIVETKQDLTDLPQPVKADSPVHLPDDNDIKFHTEISQTQGNFFIQKW